jgi:hypothetical protein
MFIHFKLNLSLYDDNEIYDKYGSYTSFNIPDKYLKYITNGKTSKKVLTLLKSPINVYEVFDACQGSCGSRGCEFETRKRLELANITENINDTTFRIFYTLDEKTEIWNKYEEGIQPNICFI